MSTPPTIFDAGTHEGYPTTGLYQSFNGMVYLGGLPIIRVERATFTISQGVAAFYEVGQRHPTIYSADFDVRGNISRAYINGAEWRLALGYAPGESDFDPGKIYDGNTNELPVDFTTADKFPVNTTVKNFYPVKTVLELEVNYKDGIPVNEGSSVVQVAKVDGVMINTASLRIGRGGELIRSGPIDWIGETIEFTYNTEAGGT